MEILSPKQTLWIFNKVKELTDKYIKKLPFGDNDWKNLHDDLIKLADLSRNNKLMIKELTCVMEYFEEIGKENNTDENKL